MNLGQLCGGVKPYCPGIKNREAFIDGLFEAAGQKPYISRSYKQGLCNGGKSFVIEQKALLRSRDNFDTLTDFFMREIADTKVVNVIAAFGIPEADEPDKVALCRALALQMKLLIDSDDEAVDDILPIEYQKAKNSTEAEPQPSIASTRQPIYPGDSIYMVSDWRKRYEVKCDEHFEHTWVFDNIGTHTWTGRRLYFQNHDEVRPRAESNYVAIPETPPGKRVAISVNIDSRSFEKCSECVWVMLDNEGRDCFPHGGQFTIIVDATFQIEK